MIDINKLTTAKLVTIYTALGFEPIKTDTKKADIITLFETTTVAPKQIAHALKETPFNVRQALRAARKDQSANALVHTHTMKTRWELNVLAAIDLFPSLAQEAA